MAESASRASAISWAREPLLRVLRARLTRLCGCFRVVDAPAVDEAVEEIDCPCPFQDLWIQVQVDLEPTHTREKRNFWPLFRETLLVLSVVARIDYGSSTAHPLPPGISKPPMAATAGHTARGRHCWNEFAEFFHDDENSTCVEKNAIQLALDLAHHLSPLQPLVVPVRLDVELSRHKAPTGHQAHMLQHLAETILTVVTGEDRHHQQQRDEGRRGGGGDMIKFQLDSMDLNLRDLQIDCALFHAATSLLETGIPINTLTLPADTAAWMETSTVHSFVEAWALFSATIFGHRASEEQSPHSSIRGVVLPSGYSKSAALYVPFFSALAESTRVQTLRVESRHGTLGCATKRETSYEVWLGFALWTSRASLSVESLDLDSLMLCPSSVDQWSRLAQAQDSLRVLNTLPEEKEMAKERIDESACPVIVLVAGTVVRPRYRDDGIRLTRDWTGAVVADDETTGKLDVMLPGFGICAVDRQFVPRKKQRVGTSSQRNQLATSVHANVRRLRLDCASMIQTERGPQSESDGGSLVAQLLRLVGCHLVALDLDCRGVSRVALEQGLVGCSKLKTLRMPYADGEDTVRGLVRVSESGIRISSLDISQIRTDAVEGLLDLLQPEPWLKCKIEKLCMSGLLPPWRCESVIQSLLDMLHRDPRTLTHLYVVGSSKSNHDAMWEKLLSFHGQVVSIGPLSMPAKLAFLSVLVERDDPSVHLDTDTLALIFAFAARTVARQIIVS